VEKEPGVRGERETQRVSVRLEVVPITTGGKGRGEGRTAEPHIVCQTRRGGRETARRKYTEFGPGRKGKRRGSSTPILSSSREIEKKEEKRQKSEKKETVPQS